MSIPSRTPPSLLYLAIYNPTLTPSNPPPPDDEDAEEAAHILFYTSKERAVSRDRMLRQVGLAKALVNFSEIFTNEEPCNNVHSQGRRMLMVSPEPDFWIHACIELARTTRPQSISRSRGKEKAKSATIGKSKGKEVAMVVDCDESSVDDIAIREDIVRGYEQFKLKHGSLTAVLSTLGHEALSLQLERFFTPWAWSWELEQGNRFGHHLGAPLHPKQRHITRLLDSTFADIPSIIITPSHAIPSTSFMDAHFSDSLPRLIATFLPPPPTPPTLADKDKPPDLDAKSDDAPDTQPTFLGIPTMNMNMHIKLSWPGYLSFKGKKPHDPEKASLQPDVSAGEEVERPKGNGAVLDKLALDDAINSDSNCHVPEGRKLEVDPISYSPDPSSLHNIELPSSRSPSPLPPPLMMTVHVHLAPSDKPLETEHRKIYFITSYPVVLALIPSGPDPPDAAKAQEMCPSVLKVLEEESLNSSSETLPTAAKILQPKDRHIIIQDGFTRTNGAFESKGEQLYIAQRLFESDTDIQEVFSRGVNPQYWHIGRREERREVYMEVLRKETTLSDVDNVMLAVMRKHAVVETQDAEDRTIRAGFGSG